MKFEANKEFMENISLHFFTGIANDLLSLTSPAYNSRTNALDKNLRRGFLVKPNRSECVLNWLLPLIFGWTGLKFKVTPTFTKSFTFLNRVNIFFFRGNKQEPGTIKLSENVRLMGVFVKSKSTSADQREEGA